MASWRRNSWADLKRYWKTQPRNLPDARALSSIGDWRRSGRIHRRAEGGSIGGQSRHHREALLGWLLPQLRLHSLEGPAVVRRNAVHRAQRRKVGRDGERRSQL